ncbi:MAG: carbamoyltransferase N-terminal domain-containing protein, partial [Ekhidna sp.]
LRLVRELRYPNSLGLLYSAFTYFAGFRVNFGEYKLMGLAPYGEPTYVDTILKHLLTIYDDGSIKLNLDYFGFRDSQKLTNKKWDHLFNGPPREPESVISKRELDLAASIQKITEIVIMKMAKYVKQLTSERYLCLAGGVALNCVANGKLLEAGIFDDIWVQPAAGDAGGALGAALAFHYNELGSIRDKSANPSEQLETYLGPKFSHGEICAYLEENEIPFDIIEYEKRADCIARMLANGKIVGHFSGRMEFGPRALGARSILGDARNSKMQKSMNLKIKYRESFRPFAPIVLEEDADKYFELDRPSPFMSIVAPVRRERIVSKEIVKLRRDLDLQSWVSEVRSEIPAVTHVDYSARIQTINQKQHKKM